MDTDQPDTTAKERVEQAFHELGRHGYFARQDFRCCQTCGWAALPYDMADKAVFYNEQDAERLREEGACRLTWAGDAKFICEVLSKHGITTKHDGSERTRIEIILSH